MFPGLSPQMTTQVIGAANNPISQGIPPWLAGLIGAGGAFAGSQGVPSSMQGSGVQNTAGTQESAGNTTFGTYGQNWLENLLKSTTTGTTTGATSQTGQTTLSPEAQQFVTGLMGRFSSQGAPISADRLAGLQTQQINEGAGAQLEGLRGNLAARGLATSPAAAASEANLEANRVKAINQAQAVAPITANQMNMSNIAAAVPFLNALPRGFTTSGTTQGTNVQDVNQQNTQLQNTQQTGSTQTSNKSNNFNTMEQASNQQNKTGGGLGGLLSGGISTLIALLPFLSDERTKHSVKPITVQEAADKISRLKPKTWEWNGLKNVKSSGVMAQELEKEIPELVNTVGDIKTVNYIGLIPYLVGAVQNLKEQQNARV